MSTETQLPYIDALAQKIWAETEGAGVPDRQSYPLYRMYAVLALVRGEETSNENVHDAWSAWQAGIRPNHPSLVPFDQLAPKIQDLDTLYRDAIRRVARAEQEER